MKCSLCGHEFREEEGRGACRGCPLARGCRMIKCPNCGYEMPAEPGLLKKFRRRKSVDGTRRGSPGAS